MPSEGLAVWRVSNKNNLILKCWVTYRRYCTPCPSGEHAVLPARERSQVVVRRARIEATSLASQGDPTPYPNVDARAEIEDSASKLPGCRIWLAVNLGRTLLIVRVSAADGQVRRDP